MWEIRPVFTTAKLNTGMNANELGRRLGIGVRIAGRIAQQRAAEKAHAEAQNQARNAAQSQASPNGPRPAPVGVVEPPERRSASNREQARQQVRQTAQTTQKLSRAAGKGLGGFLRPFTRVGGILWLEVTGFFFGLFALFFAQDIWRTRLSYLSGPQHQRFLVAAGMTALFGYLCISAFWRAKRK